MKRKIALLIFTFSFNMIYGQPWIGKNQALFFVIGHFDKWSNFSFEAYEQVESIANELELYYGFDAEIIRDPSKQEILEALSIKSKQAYGPNDQLLLYFSSHGIYEEGRKGALIPRDGKRKENDDYETWITYDQLEEYISAIACEHVLLSIDACYSGTFSAKYRGEPLEPAWGRANDCLLKMKNALKKRSKLYLTSGGVERTPVDSHFARKWLEALRQRTHNGTLSYHGLLDVLYEAVPTPVSGDFANHDNGNFIFVRNDACEKEETETTVDFLSFYRENTKYVYKQLSEKKKSVFWLLRNLNLDVPGSASYCYGDNEFLCNEYGRLYTWEAANKACRALGDGWRLPTIEEVKQLALLKGGGYNDLMRTAGSPKQAYQNLTDDDEFQFYAQLGGSKNLKGKYRKKGTDGFYWAVGNNNSAVAPYYHFNKSKKELVIFNGPKDMSFSCRCVKDAE